MIANYLDTRGRSGPFAFILSFVALAVLGSLLVIAIDKALHENHHLSGIVIFLGILVGIVFTSVLLMQAIRRTNDMGKAGIFSIFCLFPAACVPLFWFYSIGDIFASPARMLLLTLGIVGFIILVLPRSTASQAGH